MDDRQGLLKVGIFRLLWGSRSLFGTGSERKNEKKREKRATPRLEGPFAVFFGRERLFAAVFFHLKRSLPFNEYSFSVIDAAEPAAATGLIPGAAAAPPAGTQEAPLVKRRLFQNHELVPSVGLCCLLGGT